MVTQKFYNSDSTLFILTSRFCSNPQWNGVFVVLLIVVYKYFSGYAAMLLFAVFTGLYGYQEEINKKLAQPYTSKFIASYTDEWGNWPEQITINDDDINTFRLLLSQEHKVYVSNQGLKKFIKEQIEICKYQHFARSFMRISEAKSTEQMIEGYTTFFANDMTYLDYIKRLMKDNGNKCPNIKSKIQEANKKNAQERKIEKMKKMMDDSKGHQKVSILNVDGMTGIEFEHFLGKMFSKMGYETKVTKASGDQGADLLLEKFGEKTAIQAKCYSGSIGNGAVQEVIAAKAYYNCHNAMVVTNNYFTASAIALAKSSNVQLWDREKLSEAIIKYW